MSTSQRPPQLLIDLLAGRAAPNHLETEEAWNTITLHAGVYGVSAAAAAFARPLVAAPRREWCDQMLRRSWRRHERSLSELAALHRSLQSSGIQMLALKGPLLAQRAYRPPFARRPCHDLDIGLRRSDLAPARELLTAEGYEAQWTLAEARLRSHHLEMWHPSRYKVEIHFRLSHGFYGIPIDDLFSRAERLTLADREICVPARADQLLHAILHGAQGLATFFHTYEIRHLWKQASAEARREALIRAAEFGFGGVVALADIASSFYWEEALLTPEEASLTKTWLGRRIDSALLEQYLRHADPGRRIGIDTRIHRRWLDLQITSSPMAALRLLYGLAPGAAFVLWRAVRGKQS